MKETLKLSSVLMLLFSIIVFNNQSVFGEEKEPLRFKVKADVAMEDKSIAEETKNYIKKELEALDNVIVVDEKADFIIWVVMSNWGSDNFINFAITYLQTHRYRYSKLLDYDKRYLNNNELGRHLYRYLANYVQRADLVYALAIKGCYYKDLKNQCQSIVAEFNRKVLDPERKSYKEFGEKLAVKPSTLDTD